MLLSDALDMFVNEKKSEGVSPKTVSHYYQDIGYFIKFVDGKAIEFLSHEDILNYRLYLLSKEKNDNHFFKKSGGNLSKVTINTYLRTLRTFLRYLADYGLIEPLKVKMLREPKRVIEILDDHEIAMLINMSERTWLQQRNKLMIYMMLDAGLRRQEVLNLEIDNVDIINNLIKVKNSKGEKDRNVPLGNMTKRLFIKYINSRPLPAESTNCVFLTIDRLQITEDALKMVLQRIQKRLGFKKFNPHYLRHTFATKFIINQYEITGVADIELLREILGHESTRMCRAYLHLANQYLIKSHQFGVLANVKRKM